MKYHKAIFFTFLIAWAHLAPAYFVSQPRYKTYTRVLGVSALALLLPLGYAYKQWRDVKKLKPHEQKTTDAQKKKSRAIKTASISAALLALAGIAYYLISPCPMRQLSVQCQLNNCTLNNKQCGHASCGAQFDKNGNRTKRCGGTSCGWWAFLNAWAVQKLVGERQPITSQAVQQKAQTRQGEINYHGYLADHQVMQLAENQQTGISNPVMLHVTKNGYEPHYPVEVPVEIDENFNFDQATDITQEKLQHAEDTITRLNNPDEQLTASFICHVNENHWTSVTVKKQRGQNPELFYCDSWFNNEPPQALSKFMKEKFPTARAIYTAEPPVSVQPPVVPQPPAPEPAPPSAKASNSDQREVDLEARRKLREELEASRKLREEQDRAYEEALAADRAKDAEKKRVAQEKAAEEERIAREAIEKERAEAARIKKEADEAQQLEQTNREKMRNRWKGPQ